MNSHRRRYKPKKRNGIFRKWHRRIGFAASLFLANLAITGLLLNHYELLGLHQRTVSANWLLDLYHIKAPDSATCFELNSESASPLTNGTSDLKSVSKQRIDSVSVCQVDSLLYLNDHYWKQSQSQLIAVFKQPEGLLIGTKEQLYYLTDAFDLIDEISLISTLQSSADELFTVADVIVAKNDLGLFQLDIKTLQWNATTELDAIPIRQTQIVPPIIRFEAMQTDYRQRQISYLRIIQDLHSGRIVGLSGTTINDITAVLLLLLAISGIITWWNRKNKK